MSTFGIKTISAMERVIAKAKESFNERDINKSINHEHSTEHLLNSAMDRYEVLCQHISVSRERLEKLEQEHAKLDNFIHMLMKAEKEVGTKSSAVRQAEELLQPE